MLVTARPACLDLSVGHEADSLGCCTLSLDGRIFIRPYECRFDAGLTDEGLDLSVGPAADVSPCEGEILRNYCLFENVAPDWRSVVL
jgi:hypothetical protein